MKNITTIILVIFFSLGSLLAQNQAQSANRVKAAKVKFFNEKLELTKDEASKFWPIYNDYDNRKRRILQERKNLMQFYNENMQNMDDQEISETLEKYIQLEKRETKLLNDYNEKFKAVLPESKVIKVYIAEVQFKSYLIKQLRTSKPRVGGH